MIAFLEQGDFLKRFIRFAEDDGSQVADYRWSVDESPRARHFAIRFVRMADRGRIQITLRDCTTEVETEHGLRNEMLRDALTGLRSEEHTSELQSLMRISYAVFCLKKKIKKNTTLTE